MDGFRAIEKRVPVGADVAVRGTLREKGPRWEMVFDQMDHQGSEKAPAKKR